MPIQNLGTVGGNGGSTNAEIIELKQWVSWDAPQTARFSLDVRDWVREKQLALRLGLSSGNRRGNEGFMCWGNRNTLLLQTAAKLGFYHIHDGDARILLADEDTSFCLCVDSLMRIKVKNLTGQFYFLMKICSVILHILTSKTIQGYRRNEILVHITEALRRSRWLFVLMGF
jgi:hypothetical protein